MDFESFVKEFKMFVSQKEWKKNTNTEYTGNVKQFVNNWIKKQLGEPCSEYFKIDYTGWKSSKKTKNNISIYDWDFMCALEHENNCHDWTYEVLKLSYVHSKLRVVIGYVKNITQEIEKEILDLQVSKFQYPVVEEEPFYVILVDYETSNTEMLHIYQINGKRVSRMKNMENR